MDNAPKSVGMTELSVVLRTIEAFPRGRTTEELVVLLDAAFDEGRRQSILAELQSLAQTGSVRLGRNGRWTPASPAQTKDMRPVRPTHWSTDPKNDSSLLAIPVRFSSEPSVADRGIEADDASVVADPQALLRYWRSTLRSDPRGAITQTPDRHGEEWILATGNGPVTPEEQSCRVLTFQLESLPAEFRQALLRREANELSLAVGWPVTVSRKSGVPVIWPVGLLAAEWSRDAEVLRVTIDADDVLVNPDWLEGVARTTGWQKSDLTAVFTPNDGLGLRAEDFLARLREAAAGHMRGQITGRHFASQVDLEALGIYDVAALFLPAESTFTAGAVRDLDAIANWPADRLRRTALAPVLGLQPIPAKSVPHDINVALLNAEQIDAVRSACAAPLSVVTGPPGTGKSQTIVSMAASVLLHGGTVLVASKNHQALDAVEERLGSLAPNLPFLVRTLNPDREIDQSVEQVLSDMLNEMSLPVHLVDADLFASLAERSADRRRTMALIRRRVELECEIADLAERIAARERYAPADSRPVEIAETPLGFFARTWRTIRESLAKPKSRQTAADIDPVPEGAPLSVLKTRIVSLRRERDALSKQSDPIRQTEEIRGIVTTVLPSVLSRRVALGEDERTVLASARADHQFHGNRQFPLELTRSVLAHRPLWLASILGTPRRIPLDDSLFDLVIFDEASQCDIASALPLLARAKRAVVVGDDRQLSFIPQLGQAQDRNLMKAQGLPTRGMGRFAQSRQSLFDFAKSVPGVPRILLRHQYRSAGPIVDYISDTFYGGRLTTSYDPATIRPPRGQKPGISWTHVPGPPLVQPSNVNLGEAEAIAAHIQLLLVDQGYDGSMGVISPFRLQVHAIEEAVRSKVPAEKLEGADFRVATVDGFQGQERDVVLFSPCLSANSAMTAVTFVQKDLRRLNVAISRARAIAHVFGDLDYARSAKVRALARLAAVATEPRHKSGEGVFDSEWERRVFYALKARGLDPQPQYEVAGRRLDFALFGQTGVKLDLEVDGRLWHQSTDGGRKLSDHWRDHQLRSLGWRVRRFWVDELSKDMEACLDLVERDLS
jgi:very-short-patch-repair endonuclease